MERTFVRFGDIPENRKSTNHLTGETEIGISVYDAIKENNFIQIIFPNLTYSACVSLSGVIDRPAYEVSGEVIGRGSDGEPLLFNVKIVQRLTLRATDAEDSAPSLAVSNAETLSTSDGFAVPALRS